MSDRVFLDTNIFVYAIDNVPAISKDGDNANPLVIKAYCDAERHNVGALAVNKEFLNVALTKMAKPMTNDQAGRYLTSRITVGLHMIPSSMRLFSDAMDLRARYRYIQ